MFSARTFSRCPSNVVPYAAPSPGTGFRSISRIEACPAARRSSSTDNIAPLYPPPTIAMVWIADPACILALAIFPSSTQLIESEQLQCHSIPCISNNVRLSAVAGTVRGRQLRSHEVGLFFLQPRSEERRVG